MGVCESSPSSQSSKNKKNIDSISSFEDNSTTTFTKSNPKKNSNFSLKQNNGYILPENLSKRDDIDLYVRIRKDHSDAGINANHHDTSAAVRFGRNGYSSYAERQERRTFRCHLRRSRYFPLQGKGEDLGCQACQSHKMVCACIRSSYPDAPFRLII